MRTQEFNNPLGRNQGPWVQVPERKISFLSKVKNVKTFRTFQKQNGFFCKVMGFLFLGICLSIRQPASHMPGILYRIYESENAKEYLMKYWWVNNQTQEYHYAILVTYSKCSFSVKIIQPWSFDSHYISQSSQPDCKHFCFTEANATKWNISFNLARVQRV